MVFWKKGNERFALMIVAVVAVFGLFLMWSSGDVTGFAAKKATAKNPSPETRTCVDSDGGRVLEVKGFVSGEYVNGQAYRFDDRCTGRGITEHTCKNPTQRGIYQGSCPRGAACRDGACASLCGNGRVDPTENCGTCPADAGCQGAQECAGDVCVDGSVRPAPMCGDGRVDEGENCLSCPADAPCAQGQACVGAGECRAGRVNSAACTRGDQCASGVCARVNPRNYQEQTVCIEPRQLGEFCNAPRECVSDLCGRNDQRQQVCEEPNPIGAACYSSGDPPECISRICGINNNGDFFCEEPNQAGERCNQNAECSSGLCGVNNEGLVLCEVPNSNALGDRCHAREECASEICGPREPDGPWFCEEPNSIGAVCYGSDRSWECASGICGVSDDGRGMFCEDPNPAGARCSTNNECASNRCDGVCA